MAIKMRTVKGDPTVTCKICGATRKQSLEIFEIAFTDKAKLTICDLCNDKLLYKTIKASCRVNEKLKSKEDMLVIRKRSERGQKTWFFDENDNK